MTSHGIISQGCKICMYSFLRMKSNVSGTFSISFMYLMEEQQLHNCELIKQTSNKPGSSHKCFASTFPHKVWSLNESKDTEFSVSAVAYNILYVMILLPNLSDIWSKSRQMIRYCNSFTLNLDCNNSRSPLMSTSRWCKKLRGIGYIYMKISEKETKINKNLRHSRMSLGEGRATTWETGSCKFIIIKQQQKISVEWWEEKWNEVSSSSKWLVFGTTKTFKYPDYQ